MRPGDTSGYGAEAPLDLTRAPGAAPHGHVPTGQVPTGQVPPPGPGPVDGTSLLSAPPSVITDPARWGWRGRIRRLTGGLLKPKPGEVEARHRLAEVAVRQYIGGARLVMVANPKGGAGVTTAALMLAHTLATLRGGSTVVWDNNEARGTLADRAEVTTPSTTVWHLLGAFDRLAGPSGSAGDMSHYLRSQPSKADVLASDVDAARREQIGAGECGRLGLLLSRFYRLTVMDTGNNPRATNWLWGAHSADVLVVPITLDPDVAQAAAWMLDTLVAHGRADLVSGAVTVIRPSTTVPDAQVRAQLLEYFAARTALVVEVPVDDQLAGGKPVVYGRVSELSRRAWIAAAAAVADRLAAVHSTRPDQMAPPPPPLNRSPHQAHSRAPAPSPQRNTADQGGGQASVTALSVRRAQAQ